MPVAAPKGQAGLDALCEATRTAQARNRGWNRRQFRAPPAAAMSTLQAVNHPARPRRALPLLLLPALVAGVQAQGTPAAAPPAVAAPVAAPGAPDGAIETAMAERVRGLVGPAVPLPAGVAARARVSVEIGKLDPRLRLAPCRRIEPQLPSQGSLWGRTRIGLRCVEGERPWQVWLPVVVKVHAPAIVPVRALAAGTVLAAEHLQVAEVDWAAEAQAPMLKPEELIGRTLGRALQPGQAVRQADLRTRQWFAAGDTVLVRARGDGFVVAGEAQALGHGLEGQPVRVRTESGRVLTALPVAERQVEVTL